jgi:hypothetical protein
MRLDGRRVASRHRTGERLGGRAVLERFQGAARERQERRARDRLRSARRVLERLDGAREEGHLPAGGEHRRRVVEDARSVAHRDGRHPQRPRDLLQGLPRVRVRPGHASGGIAQRPGRAAPGNGAERVQRSGASASLERGTERPEA